MGYFWGFALLLVDLPQISSASCQVWAAGTVNRENIPALRCSEGFQLCKVLSQVSPCTLLLVRMASARTSKKTPCPHPAAKGWLQGSQTSEERKEKTSFYVSLISVPRQKHKTYKWINSHGLLALLNSLHRAEGKVISRCMASNKLIITLSDQRFEEVGSFVCEITIIVC